MHLERVVVNVQRCEGDSVGAFLHIPHGCRLDHVRHLKEGLKGGVRAPLRTLLVHVVTDILLL